MILVWIALALGYCALVYGGWRYERTLRNILANWREEVPKAQTRLFDQYVQSVCLEGSPDRLSPNGIRTPVDHEFTREVEAEWSQLFRCTINDAHRTAVAAYLCQRQFEQAGEKSEPEIIQTLKNSIRLLILRRMQPRDLERDYAIKRTLLDFLRNLCRGRVSNLLKDIADNCAHQEAFHQWCRTEKDEGRLQLQ